jgi:hypothetical protein
MLTAATLPRCNLAARLTSNERTKEIYGGRGSKASYPDKRGHVGATKYNFRPRVNLVVSLVACPNTNRSNKPLFCFSCSDLLTTFPEQQLCVTLLLRILHGWSSLCSECCKVVEWLVRPGRLAETICSFIIVSPAFFAFLEGFNSILRAFSPGSIYPVSASVPLGLYV